MLTGDENTHYLHVPYPDLKCEVIPEQSEYDNVKVFRHCLRKKLMFSPPLIDPISIMNAGCMAKKASQGNYDIVHGHNPAVYYRAALNVARKKKLPLIYEYHQLPFDSVEINPNISPFFKPVIKKASLIEEASFIQKADRIIVQTKMKKERLIELFRIDSDKIRIIPAAVNEAIFDSKKYEDDRAYLRHKYGWEDKIVFMYSGLLHPSNGVLFFLESLKHISEQHKNIMKVVICGRGPLVNEIEKYRNTEPELLELLGQVPYDQMPRYYKAIDVLVVPMMPSWVAECSNPSKILEGMAMEKIVLGSNVKGITELLVNNENGIVYEKGVSKSLVEKIIFILDHYDSLNSICKNARRTIIQNRTSKHTKKLLDSIYTSLF